MKIENFFALRYIISNKKNKDISSASLVVIIVIATAIVFFILAVSFMNGYIYGIMKIAYEVKSFHIDYPVYFSHSDTKHILDSIRGHKEVLYADIYRETKVLLSANSMSTGLIYFRSVPSDIFDKDPGFRDCVKILEGNPSLNKNEIIISRKTAEKLRVSVNDKIYITAMQSKGEAVITLKRLTVSGIFTTGYVEMDERLGYVGHSTGNTIFKNKKGHNIFIKLKDFRKTKEVIMSFRESGYIGMLSWYDANYNEMTALKFEKNIIAFIVILVVFVAALNILTTIYLTVYEKQTDIGILKAIGYSPVNLNIIYLLNGIYLGFIGVVIGVVIGLLIMNWLNEILHMAAAVINALLIFIYKLTSIFITVDKPQPFEIFSKEFYLDKIYTEISYTELLVITGLTIIFSIISSIVPAIKAGKIKPIEVIKNG